MLSILAQATEPAVTESLGSIVSIVAAVFLLTALGKSLFGYTGKATLIVAVVLGVGLTLLAIYGTKTLVADPIGAILAVLLSVSGAAGVDASGRALFTKKAVLIPLLLCLSLGGVGCQRGYVPADLVSGHLEATEEPLMDYLRADPDVSPAQIRLFEAEFSAMWRAVDAANGATEPPAE